MAVLVFRHIPLAPPGRIADALDSRGMEWRYLDLWQTPEEDLQVEQAQALVFMGGHMSVNDGLTYRSGRPLYLLPQTVRPQLKDSSRCRECRARFATP
jgi:GMP synthase-like glutamine amidotransferase